MQRRILALLVLMATAQPVAYVHAQETAATGGQRCPPKCASDEDLRMTADAMGELRTEAWKLLTPFISRQQGLPPEAEWRSVTAIQTKSALTKQQDAVKLDLLQSATSAPKPTRYEASFLNDVAWAHLDALPTTAQLQQDLVREIEFPRGSMAAKMFFYRLTTGQQTDVRIWDWHNVRVTRQANLDDSMLETQCVALNASAGCVVAKEHFYTVTVTEANRSIFFPCSTCESDLDVGDVLILIAMHVASKQTPEWLWATYWWRGQDQQRLSGNYWTCQDAQRPAVVANSGAWKNYSMDATASFRLLKPRPDPENPADAACGTPPQLGDAQIPDPYGQEYLATYNPFVEAGFANGLKSSCVNCHAKATTNQSPDRNVPPLDDTESPFIRSFEGHIRLDYSWAARRRLEWTLWP